MSTEAQHNETNTILKGALGQRALTGFGEQRVSTRQLVASLLPTYGISVLRNNVTTAGSATVDESGGEGVITLTADGGSEATVASQERFIYLAGRAGEVGIGLRMPSAPTGNQFVEWGGGDTANGFFFGRDATGFYVFSRSNSGEQNKVYQTDWNADKMGGTGPSGLVLEDIIPSGVILHVHYVYYGYGPIVWEIVTTPSDNVPQQIFTVHSQSSSKIEGISFEDPQVPIWIKADNNGTASALTVYFGGRQYTTQGEGAVPSRPGSAFNTVTGVSTIFRPIATFRRKSSFRGRPVSVPVDLEGLDILTDESVHIQVVWSNSLVAGASFASQTDVATTETMVEVDTSVTSYSGGNKVYEGLAEAGVGRSLNKSSFTNNNLSIPGTENVTLLGRTLGGAATITAVMRWSEKW